MVTPAAMAIATMTVMLWLMWSDTVRARKPSPILYTVRIALYLIVSAILVLNMVRYPELFGTTDRVLVLVAVGVGVTGAIYFTRRLVQRR